MQALLASPSTYYDSPDSSFESSNGSSEGHSSPRLPALSSPFSATAGHSMAWDEDEDEQDRAETDTPTKSGVGAQPAWLTEELEEEWVEQPAEEEDEAKHSPAASSDQDGSVRQSSTSGSATARVYSSLNKPRVPSSLRYGFTSPSAADLGASTSVAQQTDSSVVFGQPSPNSSSAGTFVVKSNPSASRDSRPGEEDQLQAAVRALKGPSAGLGGQTDEGGDSQGQEDGQKSPRKVAAARLGLLSLFEPPPPPTALLPSTVPAPSASSFTFAPPSTGPRTSWKSLPHFSPETDSTDATPIARLRTSNALATPTGADTMQLAMEETPSRPARAEAPAPKVKARYLRSTELEEQQPTVNLSQDPAADVKMPETNEHISPFPTTPAPASRTAQTATPRPAGEGTPALKLFSFQYDTFTRNHLAALVDEIDELGASPPPPPSTSTKERADEQQAWETSFVDVDARPQEKEEIEGDEEDSQESMIARGSRSTKRIRLSPTFTRPQQEKELSQEWSRGSARRSGRRLSAGAGGSARRSEGFKTALGASASRRRTRYSPAYSAPRSAQSRYSHPFARSLDQSARIASPSPRPSTTRDRLAEANELLQRIRAKTSNLSERQARRIASPAPPSSATSSRYHDTVEPESDDDAGEPTPAKSAPSKFSTSNPSPRKLLRRLSASDEVDQELFGGPESEEEEPLNQQQEKGRATPPLPHFAHLAAAASASLRSALESSASPLPAPPSSAAGLGVGRNPSSSRRHFARTPVSVAAAKKNRRRLEEVFPNSPAQASTVADDKPPQEVRKVSSTGSLASSNANSASTPSGHTRHRSLTTIGPGDVEALLASASAPSRMVFDREQSRWIKISRRMSILGASMGGQIVREEGEEVEGEVERSGSTEDDPFRDFESTRASGDISRLSSHTLKEARAEAVDAGLEGLGISAGTPLAPPGTVEQGDKSGKISPEGACYFDLEPQPAESRPMTEEDTATWDKSGVNVAEEVQLEPIDDEEDSPLHLFRAAMRADDAVESQEERHEETDGDADDDETDLLKPAGVISLATVIASPSASPARLVTLQSSTCSPARSTSSPNSEAPPFTPRGATPGSSSPSVAIPRSALKSTARSQSAPLTGTPQAQQISASELRVPRSVSFSDGKTSGKIEGLYIERVVEQTGSRLKFEVSTKSSEGSEETSTSREQDLDFGEPGSLIMDSNDGSPSFKASSRARNIQRALNDLEGVGAPDPSASTIVLSSFELAHPVRVRADRSSASTSNRTFRRTTAADATFLTECSFGVATDRLLQYITDVEPFEPDWQGLRSIDLSKKGAESVVRMKEFLPNLDEACLNDNEISFLTGVPSTIRTLLLSVNRISSLTSFAHLRNLERLDLSHNSLDSVHQLSCLCHLRELKADDNFIREISGLAEIDSLVRLSLRGNKIEAVNFAEMKLTRLETLDLSRNCIESLQGVESLSALALLNLDHNRLSDLAPSSPMPRLRVLRLCSNPVSDLDISFAPKLRTLFVDGACLGEVRGTNNLTKLENLSVRDQNGHALTLAMTDIRDVKRLYLSGNPIPSSFPSEKFFNLVYLELAMCQISSLPTKLAAVVPNVRTLNLNFNSVEDLSPLHGLSRLTKLTVVGARLSKCRPVAQVLSSMPELEELDLRMNPLTLPFYPPFVAAPNVTSILPSHSEHQILHPEDGSDAEPQWPAIDAKFRKALSDEWYAKRTTYRAVLLQTCPALLKLDGLPCAKERPKMARVMKKLAGRVQS